MQRRTAPPNGARSSALRSAPFFWLVTTTRCEAAVRDVRILRIMERAVFARCAAKEQPLGRPACAYDGAPRSESLRLRRPFVPFALRDLALSSLCAIVWCLDAKSRDAGVTGLSAWALAFAAGALTVLVAFLCHEWGHLLGTWVAGGVAHAPPRLWSVFLFSFDVSRSERRAFLWMSYGGYLASALALAVMTWALPRWTPSSYVALVGTALGVAATFALEIPTTVRVARGGPMPSGGVFSGEPR